MSRTTKAVIHKQAAKNALALAKMPFKDAVKALGFPGPQKPLATDLRTGRVRVLRRGYIWEPDPRDISRPLYKALLEPDPLADLIEEPCGGVFAFDAFSRSYCNTLLREIEKFEVSAPNSMNRYGVALRDVGMGLLCEQLLDEIVNPLVRRLYPGLWPLKRYHGFIVNYDPKKQGSLDLHEDDSIVTLNVCLGHTFTGGKLVFRDGDKANTKLASIEHKIGRAVLHLGSQLHEAEKIKTGQRSNLILWCRR